MNLNQHENIIWIVNFMLAPLFASKFDALKGTKRNHKGRKIKPWNLKKGTEI